MTFADEGHGFRKAANIIRAMESELSFYKEVFGLAGSAVNRCHDIDRQAPKVPRILPLRALPEFGRRFASCGRVERPEVTAGSPRSR